MLEAALYQLRSATASLDEMFAAQMRLPVEVLANAITAAKESVSAATISDVEFALNDVAGTIDQLSAADADRITPIVTLLQADVAQLKEATSLPKAVVDGIRAFKGKLKVRSAAIEKQTYRPEGTPEAHCRMSRRNCSARPLRSASIWPLRASQRRHSTDRIPRGRATGTTSATSG